MLSVADAEAMPPARKRIEPTAKAAGKKTGEMTKDAKGGSKLTPAKLDAKQVSKLSKDIENMLVTAENVYFVDNRTPGVNPGPKKVEEASGGTAAGRSGTTNNHVIETGIRRSKGDRQRKTGAVDEAGKGNRRGRRATEDSSTDDELGAGGRVSYSARMKRGLLVKPKGRVTNSKEDGTDGGGMSSDGAREGGWSETESEVGQKPDEEDRSDGGNGVTSGSMGEDDWSDAASEKGGQSFSGSEYESEYGSGYEDEYGSEH